MDHEKRDDAVNNFLDYIFTNVHGQKAFRLVLTSKDGSDLGGWVRPALKDHVVRVYDAGRGSLRAENERLREALKRFAEADCCIDDYPQQFKDGNCQHCIAREALEGGGK